MADLKFRETVQVGADKITVEVDGTFSEFVAAVSALREIGSRVTADAFLRQRTVGDDTYTEMYSPSLRASKTLSAAKKAAIKELPFYLDKMAPWVKVERIDGENQWFAMYDTEFAAKEGGVRKARAWYPVDRQPQREGPTLLKPTGPPVDEDVKYRLGFGRSTAPAAE